MILNWLKIHRLSILFLFILLTLAGTYTTFKLPVSLFPSLAFPRIVISADAGDKPIDKMIVEVTKPLEQAVRNVPGVEGIRSNSNRGATELSVNFAWGRDMVLALLQVQEALNQVAPNLPAGVSLSATRVDPTGFPMLGLSLTSNTKDLVAIKDFAQTQLQPLLNSIPGVAGVEIQGGKDAEYQVIFDPLKLKQHSITVDDIAKALTANNTVISVGRIEDRYRLYLIMSGSTPTNLDDLKHTILRGNATGVLTIADVAQVKLGETLVWTKATSDGKDAVLVNIRQQIGSNTVLIANNLKQKLSEFKQQIPHDIKIQTYYDQSQLITESASSVKDAIITGAFLAALVVLIFLRDLRLTIIVVVIIPCVISTTVLILYLLNMSFNIMTLGGIAAAVGLVIDDAVVMIEHIVRRIVEKQHQQKVQDSNGILVSAIEMLKPLAGSSLATIIIFVPLSFLDGVTGGFFRSLAMTMASSLFISFFFALLVVPILSVTLLKNVTIKHKEANFLHTLQRAYVSIMKPALTKPILLVLPILVFIIIGYLAYSKVDSGFMPHMDEGGFILDYVAKPGTSLTETDRVLQQVEKIILATPEVDNYSRRTGLQMGGGLTEANSGDYFIHLKNYPRRNIDEIMIELRNKVEANVPGLKIETAQLIEDMIGDLTAVPQPIEIKIFGSNQDELTPIANMITDKISTISGVVEVTNGIVYSGDDIDIKIDQVKAALVGLDPDSINRQLGNQIVGVQVNQILLKNKIIPIRIMADANLHQRIEQLNGLMLRSIDGKYISLNQVATIEIHAGQAEQTREDLKPMLAVKGRIEGRGFGTTMADIKKAIKEINLPNGVYIEYGGLYQQQQQAFFDLMIVFISAELLVCVMLMILYEDVCIVLSILVTTLLTLPGIFIGLFITNTELNISSMMGMTMVIGIVTEIAIFYFTEFNLLKEQSGDKLIHAGVMRMRPILMTSIIAILALSPLALGIGTGSAMQQPLAIAIISGLIVAVPLVLVVMPGMYLSLKQIFKQINQA
jgi:CzcA family heavy metal efflux pump